MWLLSLIEWRSKSQRTGAAKHIATLQHTAIHYNTLQHAATHYTTSHRPRVALHFKKRVKIRSVSSLPNLLQENNCRADFWKNSRHEFERAIINREKENPFFDFLWDPESRDGIYYKWKVYSLCQGTKNKR